MATVDSSTPRPALNVEKELAALERMTVNQLRGKYLEIFGEPTNSRHKQWLIKRTIWRMQANTEGDLSERARRRAMELANDADLRMMAPRVKKPNPEAVERTIAVETTIQPSTDLMPGMKLRREYKGRAVTVLVLADGFEFEGERYKSLTAITQVVTGKHWNGFHFFGLRKKAGAQ
jgi:hypothetical protein